MRLLRIRYVYGTTFLLLQMRQPEQLHYVQRMAARHDEAATGDSANSAKGRWSDGRALGFLPAVAKQWLHSGGGAAPDPRHGENGSHQHDNDNNNINYLCFASSQYSPHVQGDADKQL